MEDRGIERFFLGLITAVVLFYGARAVWRDLERHKGSVGGLLGDTARNVSSDVGSIFAASCSSCSSGSNASSPAAQALAEGSSQGATSPGISVGGNYGGSNQNSQNAEPEVRYTSF